MNTQRVAAPQASGASSNVSASADGAVPPNESAARSAAPGTDPGPVVGRVAALVAESDAS